MSPLRWVWPLVCLLLGRLSPLFHHLHRPLWVSLSWDGLRLRTARLSVAVDSYLPDVLALYPGWCTTFNFGEVYLSIHGKEG